MSNFVNRKSAKSLHPTVLYIIDYLDELTGEPNPDDDEGHHGQGAAHVAELLEPHAARLYTCIVEILLYPLNGVVSRVLWPCLTS